MSEEDPSIFRNPRLNTDLVGESLAEQPGNKVGSILNGGLRINAVLQDEFDFQVLRAKTEMGMGRECLIKVYKNTEFRKRCIESEIQWFRDFYAPDSRLFCLRTDFEYNEQHFVVWNMPLPQSTLSSVIADPELWPLPRRHIKEIALQIADAVQSLHGQDRIVGDLSPEHIEFIDPSVILEPYYDCFKSEFAMKKVLKCTELRIVYTGTFDMASSDLYLHDQYRAPETVFRWFCDQSSDVFSVGCLIAQLWTRSPLFIKCSPGPDYVKEMLYQYKAVLDIYPSSGYVYSLRASDPDSSIENLTYREDLDGYPLSPEVKSFLSGDCEIQSKITNPDFQALVSELTAFDSRDRPRLDEVSGLLYFEEMIYQLPYDNRTVRRS